MAVETALAAGRAFLEEGDIATRAWERTTLDAAQRASDCADAAERRRHKRDARAKHAAVWRDGARARRSDAPTTSPVRAIVAAADVPAAGHAEEFKHDVAVAYVGSDPNPADALSRARAATPPPDGPTGNAAWGEFCSATQAELDKDYWDSLRSPGPTPRPRYTSPSPDYASRMDPMAPPAPSANCTASISRRTSSLVCLSYVES